MMNELKEIIQDIRSMLESGEDYAREAVKHKHQYPDLASTYARIAQDDLAHVEMLHRHAAEMIEQKERSGAEAPASMRAIWEWEHEKQIDDAAGVRRLLDMYKS